MLPTYDEAMATSTDRAPFSNGTEGECHGEDIKPEDHDVALWRALEDIEVETSTGPVAVVDFLEDISSKPGFIPPSERGEEVAE